MGFFQYWKDVFSEYRELVDRKSLIFAALVSIAGVLAYYYSNLRLEDLPGKNISSQIAPIMSLACSASKAISPNHYEADACIVYCIDARFSMLVKKFIDLRKYRMVDEIKVAGGAKDLLRHDVNERSSTLQSYLANQVCKSIELHHSKEVIIVVHIGCGAYNGEEDEQFYAKELKTIKPEIEKILRGCGYHTPVSSYLAKRDGLYEIK